MLIDAVHGKDVLGEIDADVDNDHGPPLLQMVDESSRFPSGHFVAVLRFTAGTWGRGSPFHSLGVGMNRLTVLVDIAGRVTHATDGCPQSVAGAVAVDTTCLDAIRHELRNTRKWGRSSAEDVEFVVDLMRSQAVAVAIISVNRDNEAWRQFIEDAKTLHDAIVKDSRSVAGWASAANLLKFTLLGSASFAAMGHAIGCDTRRKVVSRLGLKLMECQTICDNEVEGPDNREVFESFWAEQHVPRRRLAQLGVELTSTSVAITTDNDDPALLLADYAAGLGLAHTLENQGRRPLPLSRQRATELLLVLNEKRKVVVQVEEFDHSYNSIFGHVMEKARELADAP